MAGSVVENLRNRWDQVSERERRLLIALGITFVVVIVVWVGLRINKQLDDLQAKNDDMRKALAALQTFRVVGEAQTGPDVPIPKTPIKLQTYLAGIADEVGITIPKFNQLPPESRGEFTEQSLRIEVNGLTMQEMAQFLQKVEGNSPVVVIRALNIKQNFREREKLNVRMDISTYSKASGEGEDGGEDADKDGE